MNTKPAIDVLICGAGAAGLTLAIELARRGVSFRLIEKRFQPFNGSRGKGIQPRTQEIFQMMGLLDRVAAAGGPYPAQREYQADGGFVDSLISDISLPTAAEPFQQPLMLPQYMTEAIMRERLTELGGRVEFGTELMDIQQDEDGILARIRTADGEQSAWANWLVATDGGRSFVRHALGIGFPGKTLGVRAVVADVIVDGLGRDVWHRYNKGEMERQLSLCPLAGTDLFQIQAPVTAEGDMDLALEGLSRLVSERSGRDDLKIRSVVWASVYSMNQRLADQYRVGRVLLAGDAAHIHPPTGGQGLNTSVQDAWNLGWKLAAVIKGAPQSLLDSYEEERRPVAADMLGLSNRLLDALKQGDVRRGREVRQLDIGYQDSSLALQLSDARGGVVAGDRAPDAPLLSAAGQPTRLFDCLAGPHWTLLGWQTPRDAVAPRAGLRIHAFGAGGDLVDHQGHFFEAYKAAPGDWILVRPDGHVGAMVPAGQIDALEVYLGRAGLGIDRGETGSRSYVSA